MTAKEYLKQYERAARRVQRYRQEYEDESRLIDAVRSLSDNDGMPHGSGISKPTEDKAIRLADKRLRLIQAELEALRVKQDVFDFICGIEGIEGEVLYHRYIRLLKWEQICLIINYSWPNTMRIHRRALDIVQQQIDILEIE